MGLLWDYEPSFFKSINVSVFLQYMIAWINTVLEIPPPDCSVNNQNPSRRWGEGEGREGVTHPWVSTVEGIYEYIRGVFGLW